MCVDVEWADGNAEIFMRWRTLHGQAQQQTISAALWAKFVNVHMDPEALNIYMDGFHFYNGDMKAQMEAHHYCSAVNDDVNQCVIFDGNGRDAKIMGVEYIISSKPFETLPAEEKKLWHSHVHEVKSGQLVAPGIPQKAEHEFMKKMIGTYGKTWHTWHTDLKLTLPTGHPLLMMGFTADGQANEQMVAERDKRFDIKSEEKRKDRESIAAPAISHGADAWQQADVVQLTLQPLATGAPVPHSHRAAPSDRTPAKQPPESQ
ncbi:MAG: DUF1264 domain-containing protein [Betaproteobacteria bacterium]|nr:DUF1264 domain-containing protein [Betaproteobacteria bacterium]